MAATVDFVQSRLIPIEQAVAELKDGIEALKVQLLSRDAGLQSAERRWEEISSKFGKLEKDVRSEVSDDNGEKTSKNNLSNILRNPGWKTVDPYSGGHRKYNKWKSKVKGVLFGEDENYRSILKLMESPDQAEIPSRTEGSVQYEEVVERLAYGLP